MVMLLRIEDILNNLLKMKILQKKNKLGLWAMEFQYPWDYRRKNNPHTSQTDYRIN